MAFQAGSIRKNDGTYAVYIPPTDHNLRLLDKNIDEFVQNSSRWKPHTWVGFISGMGLIVCTVTLIGCAVDGCFDDSSSNTILCDNVCAEPARVTAIVGEVISGIGAIIACCIGMHQR